MVETLPLTPALPLPSGSTEEQITQLLASIELENAPKAELENYWRQDWKRFVYTLGLAQELTGKGLELGSNPYFTTTLLRFFTSLDLTLANYFGPQFAGEAEQKVTITNPQTRRSEQSIYRFAHFNVEQEPFPFGDRSFDVVLFCEVIEHLQHDPVKVLLEIKRILKPNGHLILTTPNVARLENVCRIIAGANIYDPYSAYGAYGRHNREYNKHELVQLLNFCGFELEELFSADVHSNHSADFTSLEQLLPLVRFRQHDFGQYLFSRSVNVTSARVGRPAWLYRSYPPGELV
jgi:SAM-dependent methyltransferase